MKTIRYAQTFSRPLEVGSQLSLVFGEDADRDVQKVQYGDTVRLCDAANACYNAEVAGIIVQRAKDFDVPGQSVPENQQPNSVITVLHLEIMDNNSVENTTNLKEVKLYTDGGSRGNPGPSASGFVILKDDQIVKHGGKYLGVTTNNQAEYQAVLLGLEACAELRVEAVHVYMDSLLVVNQMQGIFKIKNRDLWPIHQAIKDLQKEFKKVTFTHVPRELNKEADAVVNEILDSTAKA